MADKNKVEIKSPLPAMSMGEFKAWLDGFSECFAKGSPNKTQWERIKERLNSVNVQQEVVYRDRPYWWPTWYTYTYPTFPVYAGSSSGSKGSSLGSTTISWNANASGETVNLLEAANAIGKQEANSYLS